MVQFISDNIRAPQLSNRIAAPFEDTISKVAGNEEAAFFEAALKIAIPEKDLEAYKQALQNLRKIQAKSAETEDNCELILSLSLQAANIKEKLYKAFSQFFTSIRLSPDSFDERPMLRSEGFLETITPSALQIIKDSGFTAKQLAAAFAKPVGAREFIDQQFATNPDLDNSFIR